MNGHFTFHDLQRRRAERAVCAPLRGDEAELFRDFNRLFVRTVQSRTDAPREIVDDACAFAWQQFMRTSPIATATGGRGC